MSWRSITRSERSICLAPERWSLISGRGKNMLTNLTATYYLPNKTYCLFGGSLRPQEWLQKDACITASHTPDLKTDGQTPTLPGAGKHKTAQAGELGPSQVWWHHPYMPKTLGHLWEGGARQRHFSAMDTSLTTQDHGQERPQMQDRNQGSCPCTSRITEHTSGSRTVVKSFRLTTMGNSLPCRTTGPSQGFWRLLSRLDHRQTPVWLRTRENYWGFQALWSAPPEFQCHSLLLLRFGSSPWAAPC